MAFGFFQYPVRNEARHSKLRCILRNSPKALPSFVKASEGSPRLLAHSMLRGILRRRIEHGLRSRDRRPCSLLPFYATSAAERVERFLLGKSFRLLLDERSGSDLGSRISRCGLPKCGLGLEWQRIPQHGLPYNLRNAFVIVFKVLHLSICADTTCDKAA